MQWLAEDERTNSVEEIVYFSNFDLEEARLCLKLHFFFRDSFGALVHFYSAIAGLC